MELESGETHTQWNAAQLLGGDERFRWMVDSVHDCALFLLDPEGRVATWNPGAERLKGYRAKEILGKHFSDFYTPEDVESGRPARALAVAVEAGRHQEEHWDTRKDGTRFWARVVITAVRSADGTLLGFAEMIRDASERHGSMQHLRSMIDAAPTGMLMVNRTGEIVLVNALIEKLFGYERHELLGRSIEVLVPARFRNDHAAYRSGFFADARARPMGRGRDLFGLRKDGMEVPIEIGLNPLRMSDGDFVLGSVVDITERKRAERERELLMGQLRVLNSELEERVQRRTSELSAALREREVLLQEVHHRVKNNLQVISSLINIQVRKTEAGKNRDALQECQTRVQAIALIHEKLYQSRDYARVQFSEYTRSLASSVFHATGTSPSLVSLDLAIDDVALPVDIAIPCGLVLNELITNSLKHAFGDGRPGTIRVELAPTACGRLRLAVKDDGVGLPEGMDVHKARSLGLQLVCTLAEQLDATLEVDGRGGSAFQLTFPAG